MATARRCVSAFAGIAAVELKFWTEPGRPIHDLSDYKKLTGGMSMSMSAAPNEWRLVAIPGGLAVSRTF